MYTIDHDLLRRIDELELSERNLAWKAALKAAPWRVYVDREREALASWRETEGEDLQIRFAKQLKRVLETVPIKIHPFDEIVGRPTPASSAARRPSTSAATTSMISGTTTA